MSFYILFIILINKILKVLFNVLYVFKNLYTWNRLDCVSDIICLNRYSLIFRNVIYIIDMGNGMRVF
jgi:hypothetical protein